ncbi:MAG TPA: hypothetical protein ENI20_05860 [Bacteroides sp.]|nr:hypothetical protein [Bacteroides sp.]
MKTVKTIVIILIVLILIPVSSWIIWNFKASKPLEILVMNKTVLGFGTKEHRAIFWVLLNEKFVKNDGKVYRIEKDYYGFHPVRPSKSRKYEVRRIKLEDVTQLASDYDMAYYSDTYGVFFNEWYRRETSKGKGTLIEGGLNNSDYVFIKEMLAQNKLLIGEYNFLAPPTIGLVRKKMEDLMGIRWTSWTGTYIRNLDPGKSKDLPARVVAIYKKRHNGEWPFSGQGIVLVNELAQQVIVLEDGKHLDSPVPEIQTTEYGTEQFNLPETVHYPKWFDIMDPLSNHTVADYKIHITIEGKTMLDEFGLPSRFPAVIQSSGSSPFLYLAGNYSDYPVRIWNAKLQGIRTFEKVFYTNKEHSASKFYWTFYTPLISQVLTDYQAGLPE